MLQPKATLLLLLLLGLCQPGFPDGVFSIRLDKYRNINSVLADNQPCDTFGGFSHCDMRFTVSFTLGAPSPDYTSPEYTDKVEADNIYTKLGVAFTAAFPTAANNWMLRLQVVDIDPAPAPPESVDDQTLNEAIRQIRSTSFNGAVPADFVSVTTNFAYSRSLTWSYQIYCTENYYSELCDKYCKPTNDAVLGRYTCDSSGEKQCIAGYWDPSTNCVNTYCNPVSPCKNGGSCNAVTDRFTCDCTEEYFGTFCERVRNPCAKSNPCQNGTCTNPGLGAYLCTCFSGWSGTNCDADIDECAAGVCYAPGTVNCTNLRGSFTCNCRAGWFGPVCGNISNHCLALSPCAHGTCASAAGASGYACACDSGWNGTNCDADIDECAAGTCNSAGTANCANLNGSFACNCRPGWSGRLCNNVTDYCLAIAPCLHGGCSNNGSTNFTCACDSGWAGARCDADIDECSLPGYCQNSVACVNTNGSYLCSCAAGFEGAKCDTRVNPCTRDKPCQYGNCSAQPDGASYTCACSSGWLGRNCSQDLNECAGSPSLCGAQQTCVNLPGGYRCDQPASYWWVAIIVIALILMVAAVIITWRVMVCRNGRKMRRPGSSRSSGVAARPSVINGRNVRWPNDDKPTLDDWVQQSDYEQINGDAGPPTLPKRPQDQAVKRAAPSLASASHPLSRQLEAIQRATDIVANLDLSLMSSGPYDNLRESKMIGSAQSPDPLGQSGPKPRIPDAPRPTLAATATIVPPVSKRSPQPRPLTPSAPPQSAPSSNLEVTTGPEGYMTPTPASSQPPQQGPGGDLTLTAAGTGEYMQPVRGASAPATTPQAPPSPLPPKPQKVKRAARRRQEKPAAPQPPPPPRPATPQGRDAVDHALPRVTVTDFGGASDDAVVSPPGAVERLNSNSATAEL